MKLRSIWRSLTVLFVAGLLVVALAPTSEAATRGANGLRVSPVRADITARPGETKVVTVTVTNVTSETSTFQSVVNDFMAGPDESGQPAILSDPNDFAPKHSLKRFAEPVAGFTLRPGEQKTIDVTIKIPPTAAGGGYFGAVRFGPAGNPAAEPDENVSLAGNVGSLILLKVPGDVTEKLSIASFDARRDDRPSSFFTTNKKLTATVRFQNSGNIQLEPFGKVLLKNRSGKILAQYEVNNVSPPGSVLPDSIRKFPVNLDKVGSFGQFKLEGNFGYGTSGQLLSASTTFYVIPLIVIILFIAAVLLLVFLIFGLPRLIRAYNRRVLRRAGRR